MNVYGFTNEQWADAKGQALSAMIAAVRSQRGTISYSELAARISAIYVEAQDTRLDGLLDEISIDENAAGRGMLSVVVVHKRGDMRPGPGFFKTAEQLGRDTTDRDKCWIKEFEAVQAHWKR